jgi:tetratricopeptide (TPR) repeat protein
LFAASAKIEIRGLTTRSIQIDGEKARLRVEAGAQVIDAQTGKEKAGYGKMLRTLECVREESQWKVWRETSTFDEIADALVAARNDQQREELLASEAELATAELERALGIRGDRFFGRGDYAQAVIIYRLAQSISEKLGDRAGAARSIRSIGNVHYSKGDFAEALEAFQTGLSLAESAGDKPGTARSLGSIAVVYDSQGNYA